MKPKAAREDKWLKNQQKLHVSDIAESFVSVIQAPQASYNNQLLTLNGLAIFLCLLLMSNFLR
jgi:hypothetical protein